LAHWKAPGLRSPPMNRPGHFCFASNSGYEMAIRDLAEFECPLWSFVRILHPLMNGHDQAPLMKQAQHLAPLDSPSSSSV
ncbi:MAG: hypothetical protein WA645_13265, partial [Pseudolabrys sp.]